MIDVQTKNKLNSDFSDFNNILTDHNHVVRQYYTMFLNGDYGQDIYERYLNLYRRADNDQRLRAFVIQSFIDQYALDYELSINQVRHYLKTRIGVKKLELLNAVLINDVKDLYNGMEV